MPSYATKVHNEVHALVWTYAIVSPIWPPYIFMHFRCCFRPFFLCHILSRQPASVWQWWSTTTVKYPNTILYSWSMSPTMSHLSLCLDISVATQTRPAAHPLPRSPLHLAFSTRHTHAHRSHATSIHPRSHTPDRSRASAAAPSPPPASREPLCRIAPHDRTCSGYGLLLSVSHCCALRQSLFTVVTRANLLDTHTHTPANRYKFSPYSTFKSWDRGPNLRPRQSWRQKFGPKT